MCYILMTINLRLPRILKAQCMFIAWMHGQEAVNCVFTASVWTPSKQMETIWEMQLFLPSPYPLQPGLHLPSVSPEAETPYTGNNAHLKAGVVAFPPEPKHVL